MMDCEARIAQLTLLAQLGLAFIALGGAIIGIAVATLGISVSLSSSLDAQAMSDLSLSTQYTSLYMQLLAVHNTSSNFTYNIFHNFANLTKETNTIANSTMSTATKVSNSGFNAFCDFFISGAISMVFGISIFLYYENKLDKLS
ncbi:MAG: hypothetical protein QXO75_00935 [Nitrososphaerota archaeon]